MCIWYVYLKFFLHNMCVCSFNSLLQIFICVSEIFVFNYSIFSTYQIILGKNICLWWLISEEYVKLCKQKLPLLSNLFFFLKKYIFFILFTCIYLRYCRIWKVSFLAQMKYGLWLKWNANWPKSKAPFFLSLV